MADPSENFVAMMNTRAAQLGCTNTVFTNPTGLPDENQHTTAHDMALIMKAATENPSFSPIASANTYTIPATNVSGGARSLTSKFTMTNNSSDAYYQGCLGGKEGFTEASQSTLVCSAQRNDVTLICVILKGASGQTDDEAITLLDYGFSNFQLLTLGQDDFSLMSGRSGDRTCRCLSGQPDDPGHTCRRPGEPHVLLQRCAGWYCCDGAGTGTGHLSLYQRTGEYGSRKGLFPVHLLCALCSDRRRGIPDPSSVIY